MIKKLRAGQSLFYIYGGGIEHFLPQTLFLNELLGVSCSGYLPSQDWEVDIVDKLGEDLSIKGSVIRCWRNFTTVEGEISQESKSRNYTLNQGKYQLTLPMLIEKIILEDDSIRLLSQILEGLNYLNLYIAYSSKGRKPAVSPKTLFKILV